MGLIPPPARRGPPEYRCAVKRQPRVFWVSRWAGGRPPEGRPPAQRETPFHEDAGSEWSRRSGRGATGAVAPVAIFSPLWGPVTGAPAVPMPLAWALQGPPGAPRHPIPPFSSWRPKPPGTGWRYWARNPHGGAASCAAMEDSPGQRRTGGTPPVFRF
ncbi:hypothetical protein NDU88_006831 [Pleurodeles waltl]|uniref:Uncharacterized protein n=1 Tax=Pleurodeles waltl TaxID=8319 RepID=A0AAV7ME62_PLEWA|nr:hypothetical protein NDU88_006831 [Pleurodeles waltl]